MKKILHTVTFLLIFSLCGCSSLSPGEGANNDGGTLEPTADIFVGSDVETLKNWSFLYREKHIR